MEYHAQFVQETAPDVTPTQLPLVLVAYLVITYQIMELAILAQSVVKHVVQKPDVLHVILDMLSSSQPYSFKYTHALNAYIHVLLVLATVTPVRPVLMDSTSMDGSACPYLIMASKYMLEVTSPTSTTTITPSCKA